MKLHVLSDLHLEFGDFNVPEVEADAVVLAGDTHLGLRGLEWACERLPEVPKLYLLGNHEFYRHATPDLNRKSRAFADSRPDVFLMDRDSVVVGSVTFLGCTLWTDFALLGPPLQGQAAAESQMNDYRTIRVDPEYRRLRARDVAGMHHADRRWLEEELDRPRKGPLVVVTHHAPSARSLNPDLPEDPLDAAYASDLDELVAESGASLWIHGHTHHPVDYLLGRTRVLSNPRGYVGEVSPRFVPDLVVEV